MIAENGKRSQTRLDVLENIGAGECRVSGCPGGADAEMQHRHGDEIAGKNH